MIARPPIGGTSLCLSFHVKTRAWYRLSSEERQRQMSEHIAMGHRYPGVKINTTYSFRSRRPGVRVVAFEEKLRVRFPRPCA